MVMVLYHNNRNVTTSQRSRNATQEQGETVLCLPVHKGPGLNMSEGTHMDSERGWVRVRLQVDERPLSAH